MASELGILNYYVELATTEQIRKWADSMWDRLPDKEESVCKDSATYRAIALLYRELQMDILTEMAQTLGSLMASYVRDFLGSIDGTLASMDELETQITSLQNIVG